MIIQTKSMKQTKSVSLNYYLSVPEHKKGEKCPLILFLHGAGERGDSIEDLPKVNVHGPIKYAEQNPNFPFIIVAPQCPTYSYWPIEVDALNALLDEVIKENDVDTDRIYLTGLSMGGYGTWYLAYRYTERFAAIAPICGSGIRSSAEKLSKLPIWIFHGELDTVVPFADSEFLAQAIKNLNPLVKFTAYPDLGHDSWTTTYANKELYHWFLSHKRTH